MRRAPLPCLCVLACSDQDARRQQFPDEEEPYEYRGKWRGDAVWSEKTRAEILEEGNEYWRRNVTL